MMNEPISGIMSTKLVTIDPEEPLTTVKELFSGKRIHHLPVVENGKFEQYHTVKVRDVMTKKLATLEPTDKIGSAAELFLLNRFHAVPIVVNGDLIGIVTSFDILKYEFKKEYPTQLID